MTRNASRRALLLESVRAEMVRQDELWGWPRCSDYLFDDDCDDGEFDNLSNQMLLMELRSRELIDNQRPCWQAILGEEIGEVARESDPARRLEELIQVAAVALAWAQAIKEENSHVFGYGRSTVAAAEVDGSCESHDACHRVEAAGPNLPSVASVEAWVIGRGYRGTLEMLRRFEGHQGRPYWPGGESGVTLDPGVDLGYIDPEIVRRVYGPAVYDVVLPVLGLRGRSAKHALQSTSALKRLEITPEQAERSRPRVASPYWVQISTRFAALRQAPAPVQEALLSLAYNRGPHNRHLESLLAPIVAGDWPRLADLVGQMQQQHRLPGIRRRRQAEAELIRTAES